MAFHWKPFLNEYSIVKTDTPTFTESKGSKKNHPVIKMPITSSKGNSRPCIFSTANSFVFSILNTVDCGSL